MTEKRKRTTTASAQTWLGGRGYGKMSATTRWKIKLSSDSSGKTTEMAAVQNWHGGNSSNKMLATTAARKQQLHGCRANLACGEATAEAKTWLGLVAEASQQGGIGKTAATATSVIQTWLDGSGSGGMTGAVAEQTS